ncbi:hypothetical protein LLH23_20305 [bacterium]|nr:hypothetical protein [bacterium]
MAAPDFYFAINATFRWIHDNWGEAGLRQYWEALGREHLADVTERFRQGGMAAVREYWQAFFDGEPGGDVSVAHDGDTVTISVRTCPAIKHLRAHGREIMPLYCQHCQVVSEAMCEGAGIGVDVQGGGGSCVQTFRQGVCPRRDGGSRIAGD